MATEVRLANGAWEAYYRAQAAISRELTDADIWDGLLTREYAVLHALSTEPDGLRITELGDDVLITQPGMSRLCARLEAKGLVQRTDDASDARARRIRLTQEGAECQRRVGLAVARHIAEIMGRALTAKQIETLRDLSVSLLAAAPGTAASIQLSKLGRSRS